MLKAFTIRAGLAADDLAAAKQAAATLVASSAPAADAAQAIAGAGSLPVARDAF